MILFLAVSIIQVVTLALVFIRVATDSRDPADERPPSMPLARELHPEP